MLSVSDAAYCESGSPGVLRARRNRIVGNDSGIVMTSFNASGATFTAPMDFGTVADPGGNVIRCNSLANGNGHDLRVDNARAAVLSFHGNEWDHAKLGKPMVQTHPSDPASLPNGADVALLLDESNLVLSGATAGEAPCPGGQVAGPAPP